MSNGPYWPHWPYSDTKPTTHHNLLAYAYARLRGEIEEIEELITAGDVSFSKAELKRLDKSVVLLKVGAKMLKLIIKAHGFRKMKHPRKPTTVAIERAYEAMKRRNEI